MKSGNGIGRYIAEFGAAMILYSVVVIAVFGGRPAQGYEGASKALELLPILPLLLGFWAFLRQYQRFDEFYQRIFSESFALGAMLWGLIVMAWGFAENAGLMPLPTVWIAPGLIGLWGLMIPLMVWRRR